MQISDFSIFALKNILVKLFGRSTFNTSNMRSRKIHFYDRWYFYWQTQTQMPTVCEKAFCKLIKIMSTFATTFTI
jgi:hypothetical protein